MSSAGGLVRQRPNGLWEGRYVGADHRKHSVYAKTKREAQEKMRAALVAADNGIRPVRHRGTVADYLATWLDGLTARPRSIDSYRATCRLYVVPAIGSIPLAKLEADDIARMVANLRRRGDLSDTTIRYVFVVLRVALGHALWTKRVVRNVALEMKPPTAAHHERSPLTLDQIGTFLESVEGDRLAVLYKTAVGLGLRQGELLALRWSDVNLAAAKPSLTVRHTRNVVTGELAEAKTKRSERTLRLGDELSAALREHRVRQVGERLAAGSRWHDGDFVFATTLGQPLDAANVTHRFQAALAAAGLPRQRFHDLRHACATLRLEQGEDLMVVSRILGHASITTTANVYGHLTDAMVGQAASRTDVILSRRAASTG